MKRLKVILSATVTLCAVTLTTPSCSTHPHVAEGMFTIRGELTNVADSAVIQFYKIVEGGNSGLLSVISRDTIVNGQFEYTDSISNVDGGFIAYVCRSEGFSSNLFYLYVESGTYVKITGDGPMIPEWRIKSTHPTQKEEQALLRAGYPDAKEYYELSVELNSLQTQIFGRGRGVVKDSIYNVRLDQYRKLVDKSDSIHTQVQINRLKYLQSARITDHWLYQYSKYYARALTYVTDSTLIALIRETYEFIPEDMLQTKHGQLATSYIYPPHIVEVGEPMVDGTLYDTDGNTHSLAEFKGKYILIDFWSRGCGPCIASFPESEKMAERYRDKLEIVSISTDPKGMWIDYVTEEGLKGNHWNELSDIPQLYSSYGVRGIPYYVLIDPDGNVKEHWSGYGKGSLRKRLGELIE